MSSEYIYGTQNIDYSSRKARRLCKKYEKDNPTVVFSSHFSSEDGDYTPYITEQTKGIKFALTLHAGLAARYLSLTNASKFVDFVKMHPKEVEKWTKDDCFGNFYNQSSGSFNEYKLVFACLLGGIEWIFELSEDKKEEERDKYIKDLSDILNEIFPKFSKIDHYEYAKSIIKDTYAPEVFPQNNKIEDSYCAELFTFVISLYSSDECNLNKDEVFCIMVHIASKLNAAFFFPPFIFNSDYDLNILALPFCKINEFKNAKDVGDFIVEYINMCNKSKDGVCDENSNLSNIIDCMAVIMEGTGILFDLKLSKYFKNFLAHIMSERASKDHDAFLLEFIIVAIFGAVCEEFENERKREKYSSSLTIEATSNSDERIKALEEKVSELEKEVIAKQAAILKRDEKINKIKESEERAKVLEKENEKLRKELEEITLAEQELEEIALDERSNEEVLARLGILLKDTNSVFFGGHENLIAKLKGMLSDVRFVGCDTNSTLDNILKTSKYVFMKADHIGHKQVFKIKSMIAHSDAKLVYVPNSTNIEIILKGMLAKIESLESETEAER